MHPRFKFGPVIGSPGAVTFKYLSHGSLFAGRVGEGCRSLDHETDPMLYIPKVIKTVILTMISGLRITRARHVYNRDGETGN